MIQAHTTIELIEKVEFENLYPQLIEQLDKDFQMSNIDYQFSERIQPNELKEYLSQILLKLINTHYDDYLNLLYRIDVAETDLLKVRSENIEESIDGVVFLILKREVQKVWLRKNYQSL